MQYCSAMLYPCIRVVSMDGLSPYVPPTFWVNPPSTK